MTSFLGFRFAVFSSAFGSTVGSGTGGSVDESTGTAATFFRFKTILVDILAIRIWI